MYEMSDSVYIALEGKKGEFMVDMQLYLGCSYLSHDKINVIH